MIFLSLAMQVHQFENGLTTSTDVREAQANLTNAQSTEINAIAEPVLDLLHSRLPPQIRNIVTEKVLARAVEKAEFPPVKPPVAGLLTMEDGTLIVIHDQSNATLEAIGDIYDKNGKFVGSFTHGGKGMSRMIFKNGFAYTVETDDMGDNTVVRYKVGLTRK